VFQLRRLKSLDYIRRLQPLKNMKFLSGEIEELKRKNIYRQLKVVKSPQGPWITCDGKELINLSSNNYLDLANHPDIRKRTIEAILNYGTGSGASRLISGNCELYDILEKKLADLKKTETSLVFNSGYMANTGIIPAIAGTDDIIFSDELNHASIVDGCRLAKTEVVIYPHCNMDILENHIKKYHKKGRKIIITDGVFSMDGDIVPLKYISYLAEQYDCILMVDDAHATGVLGKNGGGTCEHFGLERLVHIKMGTLGKAIGSFGAYIAGDIPLREFMINRARSLIFSTALPPHVLSASIAALEIIAKQPELRFELKKRADFLRNGLKDLGFDTMDSKTQIIPIRLGDAEKTMEMSRLLFNKGVFAHGIRPPTVPENSCRIRASVIATHSFDDLSRALEIFKEAGESLRII
ncbi:MAG: 8-amino-7-oxononanoate synthase, partial [Thermodesulfobacteriota bacterium]|nr:8-amino-7-oxononanoate synthase [Thermodesulfobacteriota bacterium]